MIKIAAAAFALVALAAPAQAGNLSMLEQSIKNAGAITAAEDICGYALSKAGEEAADTLFKVAASSDAWMRLWLDGVDDMQSTLADLTKSDQRIGCAVVKVKFSKMFR